MLHLGYDYVNGEQIMTDEVTVHLTILKEHMEMLEPILDEDAFTNIEDLGEFYEVYIWSVREGNLDFLPQLQKLGIAYESAWNSGYDLEEGTEYCRFTPEGEVVFKTIYSHEINPSLHELQKLIDAPDQLREYILNHAKKLEVIPWDNQAEYGKVHRVRQLITA